MLDERDLRIVRESSWKDAINLISISLSSFKPNDLKLFGTLPENIEQIFNKAQRLAHKIEKDVVRDMKNPENTKMISIEVHSKKDKDEKYRTYPYREYLSKTLGLRFNNDNKSDQFYYGEIPEENFEKMKNDLKTIEVEIYKKKQDVSIKDIIGYLDWRIK